MNVPSSSGGGLDRIVGSAAEPAKIRFENVSQADGLSNDVIYGLEVDTNGTVWASTAYGISRFNPQTGEIRANYRRHVGIYAYRADFLARYGELSPSPLERVECLEQLRVLWHGYRMHVHEVEEVPGHGVDTAEDLKRVQRVL